MPLEQDLLGTPSLLAAVRAAAASWRSGILEERSKQALKHAEARRLRDELGPTSAEVTLSPTLALS